jgi:hypothetical protein
MTAATVAVAYEPRLNAIFFAGMRSANAASPTRAGDDRPGRVEHEDAGDRDDLEEGQVLLVAAVHERHRDEPETAAARANDDGERGVTSENPVGSAIAGITRGGEPEDSPLRDGTRPRPQAR